MKKRIIVTGGAGFIGSHLCEKLLDEGNEVICVDNFFTGNKRNIIHLLNNSYYEVVRHDFTGPLNLGNPREFTILELAEKIINITGSNSKIIYKPLTEDDPIQRQPNIDLAKKELHWEPIIQFEEGIKKTINYFERLLSNER